MVFSLIFLLFLTDDKDKADLWLLNSCTVKNPAEDHFRNSIKEAKSKDKLVVLAGCVPQGQQKAEYIQVETVVKYIYIYLLVVCT